MSDDILRDSINIEEMLLAIDYDIIKRLNDELKDNHLSITLPYQVELARLFLTRSLHPSLPFITFGSSFFKHPV